jgi:Mg2+ and Co2+ transporters
MIKHEVKEIKFDTFTWIDLISPTHQQVEKIAEDYNLDYFMVSDSVEPGHLPKIEQFEDFTFIILRAYSAKKGLKISTVQQLSDKVAFFIKNDTLITVHRADFPFLLDIKQEVTPDTTLHQHIIHIFSHIVDSYSEPASRQSTLIDEVERIIFLKDLKKISLEDLYYQKTETRISKKLLLLTQNVLHLFRVPYDNQTALQDVKDSLVKLILEYEEALEDANSIMNTYLSVAAQKSNDVMKLLTIYSAFFLPLSFIAGFYGMNFQRMPEISWKYGYPFVIIIMVSFAIFLLIWFKRKKIL